MNRRTVIALPAVFVAAPAAAPGALVDPDRALLALWRDVQERTRVLNALERADDPAAWDAAMAHVVQLENQIAAAPAETPLAWCIKILNADDGLIGETSSLGRALVDQALDQIRRVQ